MGQNSSLKVMHLIDKLSMDGINPNSAATLISEWTQYLRNDGFDFTVCTLRDPDPAAQVLEDRGIPVRYLGLGKYSPKNIGAIMALLEEEKAHLLHIHGYKASNFGRIAARRKGILNIVHGHAVVKFPHQYVADFFLRGYTDCGIAVSEYVKDQMVRFRHIPREKIQVIANGIDIGKYCKLDPEAIRAKKTALHLPVDAPIIGTVTRLREEKGNEFLIRAVPDVLKLFPQARFLIIGSGPLQQKLETLAAQLGVASQVLFLGFRKDTATLLSLFDVNVIASLREGFSLVLVESMCIGNAIVATFVGGMKEIGKDQETVLFVPPKDSKTIAEKICLLLERPEWVRELSRNAQASSRNFSLETSAKAMGRFYRTMLSL